MSIHFHKLNSLLRKFRGKVETIMSNWNPAIGQAMMTSAVDISTTVNPCTSRVKVGSPCEENSHKTPLVNAIFGILESVTIEVVWEEHQRFPDERFQHQTLCSK